MAVYLVTGGAGFIGSALVETLVERGERVRVLDNFLTGRRANLLPFLHRIELVEGDVRDLPTVERATQGVDFVLHQAALASVVRSIEDPLITHAINVEGTLHVLVAARKARVRRVVYAASAAAYGEAETLPKRESMLPEPISPYAVTKLVGEYYAQLFWRLQGLETVSLRYFNVFGPRQDASSPYSGVLSRFISALVDGSRPVVFGDGEQSRDFVYVSNVVEANLQACQAPRVSGMVFNIGTGERFTLNQTLGILGEILGVKVEPDYALPRSGDIRHSEADIELARRYLHYSPRVGFGEGLRLTVEWFRSESRFRESDRTGQGKPRRGS